MVSPPADSVILDDLPFRSPPTTGSTLTTLTNGRVPGDSRRPPGTRPHESSPFIGRRLGVDAVKHRSDQ